MISHQPWIGPEHETGIGGKRLAIVGYSHYVDGLDSPEVTIDVVKNEIAQQGAHRFFQRIASAFDLNVVDFLNRVTFFNFVPFAIGTGTERFAHHDVAIERSANQRLLRVCADAGVQCAVVFSSKAWSAIARHAGSHECIRSDPSKWVSRTTIGDLQLVGTRHPQGASNDTLRTAVEEALR